MNETLKVTLVGTAGPVGKEFLSLWEESGLQAERFRGWDVAPHVGELYDFQGQPQVIGEIDPTDLSDGEWVILALDRDSSLAVGLEAIPAGCRVVDCTGAFLTRDGVPLVVPGINHRLLEGEPSLISVPTPMACLTSLVLEPLMESLQVKRVGLTGLQGAVHRSRGTLNHLLEQTVSLLQTGSPGETGLDHQAAFACLPANPTAGPTGPWAGEASVRTEIRRVLDRPDLPVSAVLVWVPTFHGIGGALHLSCRRDTSVDELRELLQASPGLELVDLKEPGAASTMAALDSDRIVVARPLVEPEDPRQVSLWFSGDGLRQGLIRGVLQILCPGGGEPSTSPGEEE